MLFSWLINDFLFFVIVFLGLYEPFGDFGGDGDYLLNYLMLELYGEIDPRYSFLGVDTSVSSISEPSLVKRLVT